MTQGSAHIDQADHTERVRTEIERLHAFLVGWFTGALPESAFGPDFLDRFHPDLVLIPPSGNTLSVDQFSSGTRSAHGSNPDFRVAIRNVRVLSCCEQAGPGSLIIATYEEWQRNALATEPPNNGRAATVVFEQRLAGDGESEPLRWLHIHETGLPKAISDAGPYDF